MNVGMNKILIADSEAAVSVFGVYYKMQTFVFMPVFGVTQAQSIIVGYNCGAQKPQRMRQVIKLALVSGIFIMFAGTAVVHLFPEKLLDLFSAGEDVMTIGAHALRVMTMPFCLSAICIILGDALTGMGIGYVSAINSFIRQILVLLPLAYLLMHTAGLYGIWYAFVISEFVSLMVTLILFQKLWRKKVTSRHEQPAKWAKVYPDIACDGRGHLVIERLDSGKMMLSAFRPEFLPASAGQPN